MRPWLIALVLLLGCVKQRGPVVLVGDPEAIVAYARARPIPHALQARMSVKIDSPTAKGTAPASIIVDRKGRMRVELYTPIGTPLTYLTSDGTNLHAWMQRERTFYQGDEAAQVLEGITGGMVGIVDVIAILTAQLPLADSEILHMGRTVFDTGGVVIVLLGPDDLRVRTVLDPRTGMVRQLRVDPASPNAGFDEPDSVPVMNVRYSGVHRLNKARLPEEMMIQLPRLGWTVTLDFKSWKALDTVPEVFNLAPPRGASVKDLETALRNLRKDAHLPQ